MHLFVLPVVATTESDNLETYKSKSLEFLAKKNRSTPELFVKDYNAVIDSLELHSITASDYVKIIRKELSKKKSYKESIEYLQASVKSSLNFNREGDMKNLNILKGKLKDLEALESKLPEYESMKPDEELYKFFSFRFSFFNPLFGRRTAPGGFIFTKDGTEIIKPADEDLMKYFQSKKSE